VTSLRSRLLIWLMVPLVLVAAIVALETFSSANRTSNELHDRTLLAVMLVISENVVASDGDVLAENVLEVLTDNLGDQFFYHLAGPGNAFVTGYSDFPKPPTGVALKGGKPVFYDGTYRDDPVRVVAMRQLLNHDELQGWATITTWQRVNRRSELAFSLFGRSLLRLILLIFTAGAIVWLAVVFGLRPLRELQLAIDARTPQDLNPIRRPLPKELKGIVGSMNDLFARVARSKANRERFIGNAAHQLRNPIAALKVQAETSLGSKTQKGLRAGLVKIVEASNSTGRIINQMLASASANALDSDAGEVFDLVACVNKAAHVSAPQALENDHEFSVLIKDDNIKIRGHEVLMQEAIVNLIDNAVSHTENGGDIGVALKLIKDGKAIEIAVSDSGTPFSQEELQKHYQPFATGGGPRSGSGLGLSIARDVANSHGGYLEVSPHARGKKISIILPIASAGRNISG